MTAQLFTLQPSKDRRRNLAYVPGAEVIRFPKEGRPAYAYAPRLSYMDAWSEFNCQAALDLASILGLYFRMVDLSLRFHANETMRGEPSCRTETAPQSCGGETAHILQPDEPA